MNRVVSALLVVAAAAAVMLFESIPQGAPLRSGLGEWLAANALPVQTEKVTVIELASTGAIRALDAALALRAVLRYEPRGIVFLDPIEPGEAESLLLSKLNDAKVPVVFTANDRLDPLPRVAISKLLPVLPSMAAIHPEGHPAGGAIAAPGGRVLIAARQGDRAAASNVWQFCMTVDGVSAMNVSGKIPGEMHAGSTFSPVDAAGRATINALAARFLQRIAFDQLMLRTERSDQGLISVDMDNLFRGHLVAVQSAGENSALGLAALRNGLVESPLPLGVKGLALLLVATLPWWRGSRLNRALYAFGVSCMAALMSLAIYQEFRMVAPLSTALLLPLLALIPSGPARRSNEIEQRKRPA